MTKAKRLRQSINRIISTFSHGAPMKLHALELHSGAPSDVPVSVKQAIRFARRLRGHRVHTAQFPPLIDADHGVSIRVGSRIILITAQGQMLSQVRPLAVKGEWHFDPQALRCFRARQHANSLEWAAQARRCRLYRSARVLIECAAHDRRYADMERAA